jgi:hypothetical protein
VGDSDTIACGSDGIRTGPLPAVTTTGNGEGAVGVVGASVKRWLVVVWVVVVGIAPFPEQAPKATANAMITALRIETSSFFGG